MFICRVSKTLHSEANHKRYLHCILNLLWVYIRTFKFNTTIGLVAAIFNFSLQLRVGGRRWVIESFLPLCDLCAAIRHVFLRCEKYAHRRKYFSFNTLFELFRYTPAGVIIQFLRECNLYNVSIRRF